MAEERGPLVKAGVQLVLNHPFFGVLFCHLRKVPLSASRMVAICGMPTAAVDGKTIFYNEEWVGKLPEKARMGLLAHEVLHPALGHLWRRGNRHLELWNCAVDFAANDIIKRMIPNVELPDGGLYDSRFQGMAAEQIYSILEKEARKITRPGGGDGHLEKTVRDGQDPKGGKGRQKAGGKPEEKKGKGAGKGEEKGKKGKGAGGKKAKEEKGDEDGEGDADPEDGKSDSLTEAESKAEGQKGKGKDGQEGEDGEGSEEDGEGEGKGGKGKGEGKGEGEGQAPAEQQEGEGGGEESDTGEMEDGPEESMEQHWRDVLVQAAMVAKQKGNLPAQLARLVEDVTAPKVPWQAIIEQFLTEVLRDDYDMMKQDRRFIEQGIYFPDLQSNATSVAVAVDTSGSIGKRELVAFVSEMTGLLRCRGIASMRVMACDAEVTLDETLGPTDPLPENYPGGGGTDFRPVFKRLRDGMQSGERPALLVYLTDGCGTYPERDELGIPVIWMMTTDAYRKEESLPEPPFGVRIPYEIGGRDDE